jgi:hypothetical protein
VVERVITHRKPPEVRFGSLRTRLLSVVVRLPLPRHTDRHVWLDPETGGGGHAALIMELARVHLVLLP